jgi:hypothetical protein
VWLLADGEARGVDRLAPEDASVLTKVLVGTDEDLAHLRAGGLDDVPTEVVGPHHGPHPTAAPAGPNALLGAVGPLDAAHGVDLAPRLLWGLRRALGRPVTLVWATPEPGELPAQVRHDLRNLGLADQFQRRVVPAAELGAWVEALAVVVLPGREPPTDELATAAATAGRPLVTFTEAGVPFPCVEELAVVVADWLTDEARRDDLLAGTPPEHGTRRLLVALGVRSERPVR